MAKRKSAPDREVLTGNTGVLVPDQHGEEMLAKFAAAAEKLQEITEAWPKDELGNLVPAASLPVQSERHNKSTQALIVGVAVELRAVLSTFVASANAVVGELDAALTIAGEHGEPLAHGASSDDALVTQLTNSISSQVARLLTAFQTGQPLPAIPDVFANGDAAVPTSHTVAALLQAITHASIAKNWSDYEGAAVPTHTTTTNKGRGTVHVSLRGPDGDPAPTPDLLPRLWEQVSRLDDLTSDTLLVCLAHWAGRAAGPKEAVWITVDSILDARGIKRIQRANEPSNWQHGHRREDRLEAARALVQLENVWIKMVNVEVIPAGPRRKAQKITLDSRALAILDRASQDSIDGAPVFLAARVMPGQWAEKYWELGLRQTGILSQKALAYDPYREAVEKRLAKYFAFHFRYNAHDRADAIHLHVSTLLDNAGLQPEQSNPQRTRSRIEKGMDRLQADGLIDTWGYTVNADDLPAKKWLPRWLQLSVWIEPPRALRERYTKIGQGPQPELSQAPAN